MEFGPTVTLATGDEIPRLGLGLWQVQPGAQARNAVAWALEAGYRHIDTARIYGNEADVGDAIRASGVPRKDIWVTTKLFNNDQGYKEALKACRTSLSRLGLDYIDAYLIHWPVPDHRVDSWKALVKLQQDGFCRTIGVSNFEVRHLEQLVEATGVIPHLNQVEMHPFLQQRAVRAWCTEHGVAIAAYSPLTCGQRLGHPVVREVATRAGRSPAQVLLRWGVARGAIVITKSVHQARIAENATVFDWELSDAELAMLDDLDEGLHTCWDPTDVP